MRHADFLTLALLLTFMALVLFMPSTAPFFHWFFPDNPRPVFLRASFLELTLAHAELVFISAGVAAAFAISIGIFVTRRAGREFLPIVGALAAVGQTFPPAAVLALAVPALGYGEAPTLLALFLYSILPVLEATIAGLHAVPTDVREAADGLGFSPAAKLLRIELPLAAPYIIAGMRTSVIIAIGTATIGSTIGALSLGSPIVEGLAAENTAYVIQGAVVVALFAVLVDRAFEMLERRFAKPSRSELPESQPRRAAAAAAP
ncbi:MAG: osmoprotectant transport system permease protein [Methylobacteriaceae bacterium]|jgi:osmoprotectant transport system permease protein|nr:osmoprotectant transport system permease protein [Methylobacteriaceae bacterium]